MKMESIEWSSSYFTFEIVQIDDFELFHPMQNARQKQRKIYENQPNNANFLENEEKKSNINYTCKKCNMVFQRYYELMRHQKNHCFKEENIKKSAKAQIAAAQISLEQQQQMQQQVSTTQWHERDFTFIRMSNSSYLIFISICGTEFEQWRFKLEHGHKQ